MDVLITYSKANKLLMCWKNRSRDVYGDQQVYLMKKGYDIIDRFHTECLGLDGDILDPRRLE